MNVVIIFWNSALLLDIVFVILICRLNVKINIAISLFNPILSKTTSVWSICRIGENYYYRLAFYALGRLNAFTSKVHKKCTSLTSKVPVYVYVAWDTGQLCYWNRTWSKLSMEEKFRSRDIINILEIHISNYIYRLNII